MNFQEKRTVIDMAVSIATISIFGVVFYYNFDKWGFNPDNVFRFWAIFFVILVGVSVVSRIIAMILFSIVSAVVNEVKGEEQEDVSFVDERDTLIELKSSRNGMFVFVVGFLVAFTTQLFSTNHHLFFIMLFSFGLLSDLTSNILKIMYYRKGV